MRLEDLRFSYGKKQVLSGISYSFEAGKIYAIVGRSGAGKTTLLSLMSGLARPTSGRILVKGRDLKEQDPYEYRSSQVGVVFQDFNLLTKLTAAENVALSIELAGKTRRAKESRDAVREEAYRALESVGLDREEADRRVLKLSGGQQQRVAIARALSYGPDIILADEPTGSLDEETQAEIMTILRDLARRGKCVIVVTHSNFVASRADRKIHLSPIPKAG